VISHPTDDCVILLALCAFAERCEVSVVIDARGDDGEAQHSVVPGNDTIKSGVA